MRETDVESHPFRKVREKLGAPGVNNILWLTMHNSDDPELKTAALRLYLDESGGSDPNTLHVVIGGIFIDGGRFIDFENAWDRMLAVHGIKPPLHMKEFGRHGRFGHLSESGRLKLFVQVSKLITSYRTSTISVSLSNEEYTAKFAPAVRKVFGVYGMCFALAALGTQILADKNGYTGKIPIIMDSGNPYADHVRKSHADIQQLQKEQGSFLNIGKLAFGDDEDCGILQAADVISWGARRRASNLPFKDGFSPIDTIFADRKKHAETRWMPEWLTQLGEDLNRATAEMQKNNH